VDWISISVLIGAPVVIFVLIVVKRRMIDPVLDRRAEQRLSHDGRGSMGGDGPDISDPAGEARVIMKMPNAAGTNPTRPGGY
jgi:hypothetical protein